MLDGKGNGGKWVRVFSYCNWGGVSGAGDRPVFDEVGGQSVVGSDQESGELGLRSGTCGRWHCNEGGGQRMGTNKRRGIFWGGFALGAAVGAVAGLLTAPEGGRSARQLLKKSAKALPELAEDVSTQVQWQAQRFSGRAAQGLDGFWGRVQEAIATGLVAGQREHQALTQNLAQNPSLARPSETEVLVPTPPRPSSGSAPSEALD